MTDERLARIMHLIREAADARELVGLRWGFGQQGELSAEVQQAVQDKAMAEGWWPLPGR